MMGRYRASKEVNRSRFYFLLSVVFVLMMIKWGIPFMISTISGPEKRSSVDEVDIIPPQQPVISAMPEATNSAALQMEGYTEADAEVELLVNDVLMELSKADKNGLFMFRTNLKPGENRVSVTAKDAAGNTSRSLVTVITLDTTPVALIVDSPKKDAELFGKTNQTVSVTGKVDKEDTTVLINNSFALVEKSGAFSYRLMLSPGDNTIKVVATDRAGNIDEEEFRVRYSP